MKILFVILCCFQSVLWGDSWTIVANGPAIPQSELEDSFKDRKVLVLDGAVNRFKDLQLYLDCILGDFDSVEDFTYWGISHTFSELDEASAPYQGNFDITIIPAKDQNYTDLEKGIRYCDLQNASSIVIVQAVGGRTDHMLGNLGLLKKYYRFNRDLTILTEKEQIFFVCDTEIFVEGGVGEYCAILGYPSAVMSTSGLAYNGSKYALELGINESICNTIVEPKARLYIQGEALVILPKTCTLHKFERTAKP